MHINLLRTSTRRGNAHTHEVNRVSLRLPAPHKLPSNSQTAHNSLTNGFSSRAGTSQHEAMLTIGHKKRATIGRLSPSY